MDQNYLRQVAEYIIADHTIQEASVYFNKSTSSIKKYLAKVRDEKEESYDPILAEKLKLAQAKKILEGRKKGGETSKRGKTYEEFTARMYADAYLSGMTLRKLSQVSGIPKSTLEEMIRGIKDEALQKQIDDYIFKSRINVIDKVGKEQWKR